MTKEKANSHEVVFSHSAPYAEIKGTIPIYSFTYQAKSGTYTYSPPSVKAQVP